MATLWICPVLYCAVAFALISGVSCQLAHSEVEGITTLDPSLIRLSDARWEPTNATLPLKKSSIWHIPGSDIRARDLRKGSAEYLQLFVEETQWYNDIVLFFVPAQWRAALPHWVESWLRNYVAGFSIYFITGGLWCLYVYTLRGEYFYPPGTMPSNEAILKQIHVSMMSMPFYVSLPTISEAMVERGWTRCYSQIEEMGFWAYLGMLVVYMVFVEFGIYWMHRELHEIKPLYKWLHATHHIYNKQNTLSPFAGLAFHPLDGILQASPHVMALFLMPTHFFTHEALMFLESIWTTNIHDNIDEGIFPIMGAGYHTIHHTTYKHNYGHYTIWMDWMFGTLREPEGRQKKET